MLKHLSEFRFLQQKTKKCNFLLRARKNYVLSES